MILAFSLEMGLDGLWYAHMVGSLFHVALQQYLISWHYGDWKILAKEAKERIENESLRLESIREKYQSNENT
jgi:hypothetical protein